MQLIAQEQRGWAWTRAVLGVAASEIHVCGDHSCISILRSLCDVAGMSLTVNKYERLTPLRVDRGGLKGADYANVQAGDCVVAFSRKDLYQIKAQIEAQSPFRAAMIYGALPPLARRTQARLFNDPASEYQVRESWNEQHERVLYTTMASPTSIELLKEAGAEARLRMPAFWSPRLRSVQKQFPVPALLAKMSLVCCTEPTKQHHDSRNP